VGVALRWRSFFLAGVAIAIQTLCPNAIGELPADAPRWLRLVQYLIAVAIFCCFGAIASWIAFGPGERQFSGTIMTGNATIDAAIGRTAFGVGAVIIWLCTAESSGHNAHRLAQAGKSCGRRNSAATPRCHARA
jgi:membrane protease YdiL (CAAX protease family)